MTPIVANVVPCKICAGSACLYGVVDFHKSCHDQHGALPLSGIPVYYYCCPACDFVFTTAFDAFTSEDFARHIYNDGYVQVDPDYVSVRPAATAEMVAQSFKNHPRLRILDYGGGNGAMARLLREKGFANVDVYDPYVEEFRARPSATYDLILSFEVVEHSPTPVQTLRDMVSFGGEFSMILFSTLIRTPDVWPQGLAWWYIGPRNGHVSIFSPRAMAHAAKSLGLQHGSCHAGLHVLFRERPPFAAHLFSR